MNPIKALRRQHNITQRDLAEQAGISPTALLRYEQGIYENLSDKIAIALERYNDENVDLYQAYKEWRFTYQYSASKYVHPLPNLQVHPNEHPFTTWRKTVTTRAVGKDSRISFCILLAVHPSVVLDYEAAKQAHMPNLIAAALQKAGVPDNYISNLDALGKVYYDRRN